MGLLHFSRMLQYGRESWVQSVGSVGLGLSTGTVAAFPSVVSLEPHNTVRPTTPVHFSLARYEILCAAPLRGHLGF